MDDPQVPTISGDEFDALQRRMKRYYAWRPGVRDWIKRNYRRRSRHAAKARLKIDFHE